MPHPHTRNITLVTGKCSLSQLIKEEASFTQITMSWVQDVQCDVAQFQAEDFNFSFKSCGIFCYQCRGKLVTNNYTLNYKRQSSTLAAEEKHSCVQKK